MKMKSDCSWRLVTASNMSWAETMGTTSTKGGGSREVGPDTRVTWAPRSMAIRAMA